MQYLQTGHTHNSLDQRFSSVAKILAGAPVLEDPYEFADYIKEHVKPAGGRSLHVQVLDGTYDFKIFLQMSEIQAVGQFEMHPSTAAGLICFRALVGLLLSSPEAPQASYFQAAPGGPPTFKLLGASHSSFQTR